jgi:hypothetical protein
MATESEALDKILEDFRKTCFLVASDMTNDKAVKLMALTIINTKSEIQSVLNEARAEGVKFAISVAWDTDGDYYYKDDVPHEIIEYLDQLKDTKGENDG